MGYSSVRWKAAAAAAMLCAAMRIRLAQEEASFRYGLVLLLTLIAVVFFIVAPDRPASHAIGLLLTTSILAVVVVTGRGAAAVRGWVAAAAAVAAIGVAVATIFADVSTAVGAGLGIVLVVGTLYELVGGLSRLLRGRGVTLQGVAGALAVYLLVGLAFASVVTVSARIGHGDYFQQGTDGTQSQHVYYVFTTMTTTGYGDLTPAQPFGRAVSVLAMLIGQIYLVTVIALLIGNLRRRADTT